MDNSSLDWSALLQKTEESLKKMEEPVGPREPIGPEEPKLPFGEPEPLLEIDKVRGVEQAYYEGSIEECEDMISKMEAELNGNDEANKPHGFRVGGPNTGEDECWLCGKLYDDPIHSSKHEASKEAFECPVCPLKTEDLNKFERHIDDHWTNSTGPKDEETMGVTR